MSIPTPPESNDLASLDLPLSPLDGRYREETRPLTEHFSEAALNRARVHVEVEWVIHLLDQRVLPGAPDLDERQRVYLRSLPTHFGQAEIDRLAALEAETRHDVKAVELLVREHLAAAPADIGGDVLPRLHEVVHILCTSEDINNLAYALTIKDGVTRTWLPAARDLVAQLSDLARAHAGTPMLARTHGQPATPTTLGKELAVLAQRLTRQLRRIESAEYLGKLNGATGTYAAHRVAVPGADWEEISRGFVEGLGLTWNPLTTQIEPHDWQADLYADIAHFNRIAHNLATDCWTYISLGYFRQSLAAHGSTGSSTMPHKVNPIRFENAEANLEVSSALFDTLGQTLVTSRLQRDLTDSTTQRNIGVAFGHSLLALGNLVRGLRGVEVDAERMAADLEANWEVLGEAIQQAMRAASIAGASGMGDPYGRLKDLTRGRSITGEELRSFIADLGLPAEAEARLLALTPATYTGLAQRLVGHLGE